MEDPLIWRLVILLILILINALFSMSEIAMITINDNKIRRMADEGDMKAKRIVSLLETPTHFFSSTQIVITLAGFMASALAATGFSEPLADFIIRLIPMANAAAVQGICMFLVTVVLAYLTLIFGELVPKQIGMQKAEPVALAIAGVILLTGKALKPFVCLLTLSANGVLRILGIDPTAEPEEVTEEEIRMLVDIGEEKGAIAADEKELITNVFEFNNKEASDVMTHRTDLCMIWVDEEPDEIRRTIMENGYTRYPVYDEDADDILGILRLREYLANILSPDPAPLREVLKPAYFVPETVAADELFRDMQREKIHLAVVVDEYGGTRGIVTMEDLIEEIVGNIYDEYDETPQVSQQVGEGVWRIPGSAELEQLEELFDVSLPEDAFDTLGGLVFSQLRAIPEDGTKPEIEAFGLRVQVEEILDHRVEWALVSKSNARDEEAPDGAEGDE